LHLVTIQNACVFVGAVFCSTSSPASPPLSGEVVVELRPLRYELLGLDESPLPSFDVLELMFGLDDSPLPSFEVVVELRPLRYALLGIDEPPLFAVDPKPNPDKSPLLVVRSCELLVPLPVRLALDAVSISMC
jgi:hypothetical protein